MCYLLMGLDTYKQLHDIRKDLLEGTVLPMHSRLGFSWVECNDDLLGIPMASNILYIKGYNKITFYETARFDPNDLGTELGNIPNYSYFYIIDAPANFTSMIAGSGLEYQIPMITSINSSNETSQSNKPRYIDYREVYPINTSKLRMGEDINDSIYEYIQPKNNKFSITLPDNGFHTITIITNVPGNDETIVRALEIIDLK